MGPRTGPDGQKISSPPEFDPGPSSPLSVAIPTELPGPQGDTVQYQKPKLKTNDNFTAVRMVTVNHSKAVT